MTPENFLKRIVDPSLQFLSELAGTRSNDAARVLVMTIAAQESGWKERRQIGGPARGYWQFEKGGGVAGLFPATPQQLRAICASLDIPFDQTVVFEAMDGLERHACCVDGQAPAIHRPRATASGRRQGRGMAILPAELAAGCAPSSILVRPLRSVLGGNGSPISWSVVTLTKSFFADWRR
jgi:hypothetical protein